jgi:outer membrane protein OmpA-like peptidoglycan-associated protein
MHALLRRPLARCVLSIAFLAAIPSCRTATPTQRPVPPDSDGDGSPDDSDLCPHAPEDRNGLEDWDGCPEGDADRDGIPDPQDTCPNDAEDRDSFQDTDGCPDPDNDYDRLPDAIDKCPNEPETYNALEDDDGCPDRHLFFLPRPRRVEPPKGPILFDEGSARIKPDAASILDSIAAFVKDHPETGAITIAGHAAPYEDRPLALAVARAEAVRRYLAKRGVPAQQLVIAPWGAGPPTCDQGESSCEYRRVDVLVPIRG